MTKAQEIYERVNELVAQGSKKADAFREVAEEYKQPFNSMRGAYYAHQRTLTGDTPTSPRERTARTRNKQPIDPIASATSILSDAITLIDEEIETARQKAEDAEAAYQQLLETAEERKTTLQTKIDALTG
jgi:hypothetical protein